MLIPTLQLTTNPLLYALCWNTGTLIGTLLIAATIYRHHAIHPQLWLAWARTLRSTRFYLMCLGHTDIILLTLAASHIPVAVGVIILQLSPIFFTYLLWVTHRLTNTYQRPDRYTFLLSIIALTGVATTVYSEHGSLHTTLSRDLATGTAIALVAALLGSLNALSIRIGRDVHNASPDTPLVLATITGYPISIAVLLPILLIVGSTTGHQAPDPTPALIMLALGTIIPSLSGILWRLANLRSTNLAVNSGQLLLPVFSLSWLFLSGSTSLRHPILLITGAAIVITANLAISLRPQRPSTLLSTPTATRP